MDHKLISSLSTQWDKEGNKGKYVTQTMLPITGRSGMLHTEQKKYLHKAFPRKKTFVFI